MSQNIKITINQKSANLILKYEKKFKIKVD